MDFENELHCEFAKVSQDIVIGSVNERATVSQLVFRKNDLKFEVLF